MKKLMQYYIVSGNVLEGRQAVLSDKGGRRPRGIRRAGASSLKKIKSNEQQEALRLARIINGSFTCRDLFVTFKYDDSRLPDSYDDLCANGEKLLRKLREGCKKAGVPLRRVLINANWAPRRLCPARFHHHIVINQEALPVLLQLWPADQIQYENLRGNDFSVLAGYLAANAKALNEIDPEDRERWERTYKGPGSFADRWRKPNGKKWTASKGMAKPVYSEPVPAETPGVIPVPVGAKDVIMEPTYDEDGRQIGCYMRCTLPEPPTIRGGQIKLQLPKKRGGHKRNAYC